MNSYDMSALGKVLSFFCISCSNAFDNKIRNVSMETFTDVKDLRFL